MADYYSNALGGAESKNMANAAHWLGAAVSLALVAGVGVWGYKLLMRDVTGIPIVQAQAGPLREAPENPGGTIADNQGLSVNDVAGQGGAAAPADRLVLAPRPVTLTEEDQPPTRTSTSQPVPEQMTPASLTDPAAPSSEEEQDPLMALANQIAAGVQPLGELAPAPQAGSPLLPSGTDSVAETNAENAVEPLALPTGPGLLRSLRPVLRPEGLRVASRDPAANLPSVTRDIDPSSIPAGTSLVQLGAYDTTEIALQEWDRIQGRFEAYFDGRDRVIQQASSGGRVFFRLRVAGFDGLSDARRFCAALVADNTDCIPVVSR